MATDGSRSAEGYSLSERVVQAVAEAEGVPPEEVTPPLHEALDPEALDGLFGDGATGAVSFGYCGYGVTVHDDGEVELHDAE